MGPSGSGKTTFIGVLSGLDRPDEGTVTWKGSDVFAMSREETLALRRTRHGHRVPELRAPAHALGGGERGAAAARRRRRPGRGPRPRAEHWLDRLGLADRAHNRTFELSAGQQQRVAVARALIAEPELVLADEPIAEVDTENADLILEALWEVIRRGGAVLAATHNPEALRYANRVVLFRDGRIEAEGSPEELQGHLTTD